MVLFLLPFHYLICLKFWVDHICLSIFYKILCDLYLNVFLATERLVIPLGTSVIHAQLSMSVRPGVQAH